MRQISKRQLLASASFAAIICAGGAKSALAGEALPTGGVVQAGSATIGTPVSGALAITQSSARAVINWNGFGIGQANSVTFKQPDVGSAVLNRVTGSTPSSIAGSLSANGSVYLVNPNGIQITATGTVKVGRGFVGSTLDTSNADFMAGTSRFSGNGASTTVSNAGRIVTDSGGFVGLLGGHVANSGFISAPMGKIGLGSGERATLDVNGDRFLQVSVPTGATDIDGQPLVSNSGKIRADGGRVELRAATARNAVRDAINLPGSISARTVSGHNGAIVLGGGDGGIVTVSGRIKASGGKVRLSGHIVRLTGANVSTASRAGRGGAVTVAAAGAIDIKASIINASGATGGGKIRIGGDFQGKGKLTHAATLNVDAATMIRADATQVGDGGQVVLWSDARTSFNGQITARGGPLGGNGGNVEVSSHGVLDYTGLANLSAAKGLMGNLLLDPYDVYIMNGAPIGLGATDSVISTATIQAQLAVGNLTIDTRFATSIAAGAGNITVAAPLTWSTSNTLALNSGAAIAINAKILITGAGGLSLSDKGGLTFAQGASVDYGATNNGGAFNRNGQAYSLIYDMTQLAAINNSTGFDALATGIDASTSTFTAAVVGTYGGTFEGLGNAVSNLTITGTSSNVGLFGTLTVGGTIRDVGVKGGSVSGLTAVGGLVGSSYGTVTQSYTTGAVGSGYGGIWLGGLIGVNRAGTVTKSYATGAVTSGSRSTYIGGLIGATYNGTVMQSYATGAVTSGSFSVYLGGLVGYEPTGVITQSYATGAVTSGVTSAFIGGFVGSNSGTITTSYWDTDTSGQSTSVGVTGLVTTSLQGTLPTGFDPAIWATGPGLYPYLKHFFPNGVQAVSGFVFSDLTPAYTLISTAPVTVRIDGTLFGTPSTGNNGYYYAFGPSGSLLATGSQVIATTSTNAATGATNAAAFQQNVTATTGGLNIFGGNLGLQFTAARLSDGNLALAKAIGTDNATKTLVAGLQNQLMFMPAINFIFDQNVQLTGTLLLFGNRVIQSAGTIQVGSLYMGGGNYKLTQVGNRIATLAAAGGQAPGVYTLANTGDLTIGTVLGSPGINTSGKINISTTGNLTIAAGVSVAGTNPVLAAGGAFINKSGAAAVIAGNAGGQWLVYSAAPASDNFGPAGNLLDSGNTAVWGTAPGGSVTASGHRYVFAQAQVLTFTSTDHGPKTYGTSISVAPDYTVSGLQAGVAGAFLDDTMANVVSGAPDVTSLGAVATANVAGSPYAITIANGRLTALTGYAFNFVSNGKMAVTPAALTVTADAQTMTYGNTVPNLTYQSSGLVNGDFIAGTLATLGSRTASVGGYAITRGNLAASSNYTLSYTGATLNITARALAVTADAQTMTYGNAVPSLTYQTSGLVNGDSLSGGLATSAGPTSHVGNFAIGQGNLANSNYAITYTAANLAVTRRGLTVAADAKSRFYGDANPAMTYIALGLVNGDGLSGGLGTAANAASNVGTYAIGQGNLASSTDYSLAYTGANLTVTPVRLTYLADPATRFTGTANPKFSGTVTGFKLSDTIASATNGTLGFNSTASIQSLPGSYAIIGSGLTVSSGNYVFGQAASNAHALTITASANSPNVSRLAPVFGNPVHVFGLNTEIGGLSGFDKVNFLNLAFDTGTRGGSPVPKLNLCFDTQPGAGPACVAPVPN